MNTEAGGEMEEKRDGVTELRRENTLNREIRVKMDEIMLVDAFIACITNCFALTHTRFYRRCKSQKAFKM